MANYTATELVLNNQFIYPCAGNSLIEQLTDCYNQIAENLKNKNFTKNSIVKQTIFISAENNTDYSQKKQILLSCATDFFEFVPPTSIIAQSPENGSLVLEITFIEGLHADEISYSHTENSSWISFSRCDIRMLFATSNSESVTNTNILNQATGTFNQLENALSANSMGFSDVVRQWNYIEQITKISTHNNTESQHYQIFNDVRSKFYNKAVFSNGYPAATGIGQDFGGVILDILAVKVGSDSSIVSVKSPVQLDAYTYSKEVLAENNTMNDFRRTTPKFERAKVLLTSDCNYVFVSGTAAIKGQISIPVVSVEEQTEMTIQNILSLISPENLHKQGIIVNGSARLYNLRVYIKNNADMQKVKTVCQKFFPLLPAIYLIADICRPELLVEIEGQALIN